MNYHESQNTNYKYFAYRFRGLDATFANNKSGSFCTPINRHSIGKLLDAKVFQRTSFFFFYLHPFKYLQIKIKGKIFKEQSFFSVTINSWRHSKEKGPEERNCRWMIIMQILCVILTALTCHLRIPTQIPPADNRQLIYTDFSAQSNLSRNKVGLTTL